MTRWPKKFSLRTQSGTRTIVLRHSQKAKRLRLRVKQDTIELVVPRRSSVTSATSFLDSARTWIDRQYELIDKKHQTIEPLTVWKDGHSYKIDLIKEPTKGIVFDAASSRVVINANSIEEAQIQIAKRLRTEAKPLFQTKLNHYSQVMEVAPAKLRIGDQLSRWGSCSSKGTISINWRLIMAPEEVQDYIVIHELAHLKEMNHSRRFWAIVELHCPEFRTQEKWLKENGFRLMQFGRNPQPHSNQLA